MYLYRLQGLWDCPVLGSRTAKDQLSNRLGDEMYEWPGFTITKLPPVYMRTIPLRVRGHPLPSNIYLTLPISTFFLFNSANRIISWMYQIPQSLFLDRLSLHYIMPSTYKNIESGGTFYSQFMFYNPFSKFITQHHPFIPFT